MKRFMAVLAIATLVFALAACASVPPDKYNTQKGAAIGAGVGAIAGQIIGGNTKGTLIGAGVGTLLGALVGNAVDQQYKATEEAAMENRKVVYYDDHGGKVEAIPGQYDQRTDCRKVTKRIWEKGKLVSETVEEVCEGKKSTKEY